MGQLLHLPRRATAVDLFAGFGGFTTGAQRAGIAVRWCANHWRSAVDFHAANHPGVEHACQDLMQADWRDVPSHDIQLASPACQGHTRARGKERPHHDVLRNTAWAPVSCAEYHRSYAVIVENVPDFQNWVLYPSWLDAMQRLGYAISPHIIDAADHGVPQHRERLFLVCTQSKAPLKLTLPKRPYTPVADVIEWDLHKWSPIEKKGRSEATLARVASGRKRFGDRFVFPYYSSGSGLTGRDLNRPLGTVTTRDRWAVVDGDRMRMFSLSEYRSVMGFPRSYVLPSVKKDGCMMLGNAVCPDVAFDLLEELLRAA